MCDSNKDIKIICGHDIFIENAIALSVRYKWTFEQSFNPEPNTVYIVLGGHVFAETLLHAQKRLLNQIRYILLNSEQPNSSYLNERRYVTLMKQNVVLDFSRISMNYLKHTYRIHCPTLFWFEFIPHIQNESRLYDIAFIGSVTPCRIKIIHDLIQTFPELNIIYDFNWKYSKPETLTDLLIHTKVVLNIPFYTNNALETHRIHKAMSCGCDVISIPSADETSNRIYKDYIFMDKNIKRVIHQYFNHTRTPKKSYAELIQYLDRIHNNPFIRIVKSHLYK